MTGNGGLIIRNEELIPPPNFHCAVIRRKIVKLCKPLKNASYVVPRLSTVHSQVHRVCAYDMHREQTRRR